MFGLGKKQTTEAAEETPAAEGSTTGKGRPTPTRKEAELARKQALKGPTDPKARRKLEKERAQAERMAARDALLRGDERHLPPRDAGPVKAYVRDFIDRRRTLAEFFVPIAVVVLVASLIRSPQIQLYVSYAWFLILVLLIVDMTVLLLRLKKELKAQWPDPSDRKGTGFYAAMRALQIRRFRLPPPKVKAGGAPVEPKQFKN